MRGDRKTNTYYWAYSLLTAKNKIGKTRYSRNFKTLDEAKAFKLKLKDKWFNGHLWYCQNIIYDREVYI